MKKPVCNHVASYFLRKAQKRRTWLISKFMPPGRCILDLGCGNGAYIPFLKRRAGTVVGLDVLSELCKVAKFQNKDCQIVRGNATTLPFRSRAFDATWASEVIEHLPTWMTLDEIERVSRKAVLITMPNPYFPDYASSDHHLQYTWGTLRDMLKHQKTRGWRYVVRGIGFHNVPLPMWAKQLATRLTWQVPLLSPFVAVLGEQTMKEWQAIGC